MPARGVSVVDPVPHKPLSAALQEELDADLGWMYPWRLSADVTAPIHVDFLASVHQTRQELMEPRVRQALADAGPGATAIDLACNEGWFSHRLLDWGAHRVVGVDIRDDNIRRARLVRDHYGISAERLDFVHSDVYDLDLAALGHFDVVLLIGIFYHVEEPARLFRIARSLCAGLCVIEGQVTRQTEPLVWSGQAGQDTEAPGSFAIYEEPDSGGNPLASTPGVLSLIPNCAALGLMAKVAGFSSLEFLKTSPHANEQFIRGDRVMAVAHV